MILLTRDHVPRPVSAILVKSGTLDPSGIAAAF